MGSAIVRLTQGVCTVKPAGADGREDAVEVLGFSSARLVLKVVGADAPDSPAFALELRTGMDLKDGASAPVLGTFTFSDAKGAAMAQSFRGLLRYLWWSVRSFDGQAEALHFTLEGVVYD